MTGKTLNGTYRILELLGTGGMAEVYKAVQLTLPQRTVAIKILKSEYESDAAFVRRFEQEAEAVLVLSHEHIVRSYDVGFDEGRHYIVLEHVEGKTLKQRIEEQGRLNTKAVLNIGAQLLDALSHAHEKGIIHRDIKPQNCIVTSRGRMKLADFGIARQTASDNTQTFMGTRVLGSVHYISPEQAKGEPVMVESDLYAAGVTLYEMATGALPFEGESAVSIAIKHLNEQPVPPIDICPDIPPALNDIILKAMSKDPEHRYHSAKAMRHDLLRVAREPNGLYARPERVPTPRKKKGHGVLRITFAAFTLISLFVVLLLAGQARPVPDASNAANKEIVPTLVGKSYEEAKNIAKLRGYLTEVTATVASDQYASGTVLSQYPLAETSLKSGSTILITVSLGEQSNIETPALTTMTLAAAVETLTQLGLTRGDVEYGASELPTGTVFRQDPEAGTMLLPGDEVNLYISGEPSRKIAAPEVTGLVLGEALKLLQSQGFSAFRVYLATPEKNNGNEKANTVVQQNPAPEEMFLNTGKFTLTITGTALYAADLAFTLDVPENDSALCVVLARQENGVPYEMVVFETQLKAGEREVAFTAAAQDGGEYALSLYLNGTQVRQTTAIFAYRG